jgi:PPK2 family polyphosphate:nucleotide phosphotransferase
MKLPRLHPVKPGSSLALDDSDALPSSVPDDETLSAEAQKQTGRIETLQRKLYADRRYSLLIVLQGRDASGKDGTIRRVFSAVNPQGCAVTSFGVPTDLESRHDFLWRVHQQVPARGMIGIFNRSHYEDVLVARVHKLVPREVWSHRYKQINHFEHMLSREGVVLLKFYLHVSRKEQKRRLKDRLTDPTKNWKFREGDLDDRALWPAYTSAYREMLRRCSTKAAPWFVVPADDKNLRNVMVARVIADKLESLALEYPRAPRAIRKLRIK